MQKSDHAATRLRRAWSHVQRRLARPRRVVVLATVVGIMAPLGIASLFTPPIHTRGEAREGIVVRSVHRGEWVLPRREGRVPSKPPLFHWLAAVPAHAFGISTATIRSPSLVAGWVLLVVTMYLGVAMGGSRTGWLACGALLGMADFWRSALEARVDMVFAACIALSVVAGHRFVRGGGAAARVLCYAAAAAAVLAKGPAGAVLPAAILGAWTLLRPRDSGVPRLWSTPLAAAAAAVVLVWYAAAYRVAGQAFVEVQVLRENLDRAIGVGPFAHHRGRNPLKLIGAFLVHLAPWNLAIVASMVRWYRERRVESDVVLLHVWWVVVLTVFTLAAGKRSVYLLPLYPAVAVLFGREVALRVSPRWLPAVSVAFGALVVGVAATTLVSASADARKDAPLLSFARRVDDLVPRDDGLQAAWSLSENDRLVLAFTLDRSVPRADVPDPRAEYVVAALPVGDKLQRLCEVVADGSSARHRRLALLRCTACGVAPPSRQDAVRGACEWPSR